MPQCWEPKALRFEPYVVKYAVKSNSATVSMVYLKNSQISKTQSRLLDINNLDDRSIADTVQCNNAVTTMAQSLMLCKLHRRLHAPTNLQVHHAFFTVPV